MALGDGIRRNIASVDPSERALLRDALLALNGEVGGSSPPRPTTLPKNNVAQRTSLSMGAKAIIRKIR